jgi:hypothetical protein
MRDTDRVYPVVVAHRCETQIGFTRYGVRFLGFFIEGDDATGFVDGHDAKLPGGLFERHFDTANRHIGPFTCMGGDERAVVHFVDVVTGQNQHKFRIVRANDVKVLVDGVCGAAVPLATDSL